LSQAVTRSDYLLSDAVYNFVTHLLLLGLLLQLHVLLLLLLLLLLSLLSQLLEQETNITRCSAIAERPHCRVRYSFRQK